MKHVIYQFLQPDLKDMNPAEYTVEVTGLPPHATEKDVYEFFAFCGTIEHVDIVR